MFIPDMPNVPPQDVPVMIAQANQVQANQPRTLGICRPSPNNNYSIDNSLSPINLARGYFKLYENRTVTSTGTTTVVQQPKHGVLRLITEADGNRFGEGIFDAADQRYVYLPDSSYVGKDNATILVDFGNGNKVNVKYYFQAVNEAGLADNWMEFYCSEKGPYWRISSTLDANGNSTITAIDYLPPDLSPTGTTLTSDSLNSWLNLAQLDGKIADMSGFNVSVADLPGAAVGQTTGTTITLDTNAASNGWFIDPTPDDNSEFLPTSNPNEWVAKEGSDAYGKMDMLSVLLHEYGHALGIEHSADSNDYMGATLTPGVRRLPSAEELALMQNLVAQVKQESGIGNQESVVGWVSDSVTQQATLTPTGNPNAPLNPALPLGSGFLAFLARRRDDSTDALTPAPLPQAGEGSVRYEVAANTTFTALDTPQGWNTIGSVDFNPSTGSGRSATLRETSTTQTRLSQVFTVNEKDRYLTFTLSGTALDNLTGAPDDAFEVALLDANHGGSLLGTDGLTRTDAILNIQGDGTQHLADCVTCTVNPDGSRTYRIDLSGIAAGTVANLSFDLIGFGADNSHVTVGDVRVSGLAEWHDDAATIQEDSTLAFNPFAQVDNAVLALGSHLVDQPAHGSVAVNADGTFVYTPEANYFGADSFTYRLNDGALESNLATVTLTITPVNDAPVAADVALSTQEDVALAIDLLAYGSDVDTPSPQPSPASGRGGFGAVVVAGPQYGVLTQNDDGLFCDSLGKMAPRWILSLQKLAIRSSPAD